MGDEPHVPFVGGAETTVTDMTERAIPTPGPHHLTFEAEAFRPAWWLPGPHLQTVGGKYARPAHDPGLRRLRIETPDGDFLDLAVGPDPGAGTPVVLLLHGLEGSTSRAYMRVAMAEISRRGMWPIGMNFRSCSGVPNRLPRFYHSGEIGDLAFALEHLHRAFPGRPFGVLGFSLGGNVLLRFLGEAGPGAPPFLRACVAISVPFDLVAGTWMLESTPMGRVYAHYFLDSLKRKSSAKRALLESVVDLDRVLQARTLREFDEAATAPLHGFPSAEEYYRTASSAAVIPNVRVPTLILHATDDPFLPPDAIPIAAVAANPWILGIFPPEGGHVGFVGGPSPLRPQFWAEAQAARYFAEVLANE